MRFFRLSIPLLVVLLLGALSWWLYNTKKIQLDTFQPFAPQQPTTQSLPSPSPIPFAELTIPYLRSQEYRSTLTIESEVSKQPTYTSSIASYTSDGLRVQGLLTQPTTPIPVGGWPAIIFVHGYIPPTLYQTTERYQAYVDYLARHGFVVFKIDLRGHGESEGEANGAYYSSEYVRDVLFAKAALSSADFINHQQIGLWGHSMAGNVILRAIVVDREFPAAVIWGGAVFSYQDWLQYGLQDNSYRPPTTMANRQAKRQQLRETYGEFDPNHSFWKQVAATNYLTDSATAIQLHHAIDDSVVSVGYSRDLAAQLAQNGRTFEFYEYASGGHNLTSPAFTLAMQRTVAWYQKWLQIDQ